MPHAHPTQLWARALLALVSVPVLAPLCAAQADCDVQAYTPVVPFASAQFGAALAAAGDLVVVGQPYPVAAASGPGAAFAYRRTPAGTWTPEEVFTAAAPQNGERFGAAVALDADRVAVGMPSHLVSGKSAGGARIFERQAGVWIGVQVLEPPTPRGAQQFGAALAIDGDVLVVGAPGNATTHYGAAYVWERDTAGRWQLLQTLVPAQPDAGMAFGCAVALGGDTLFVAARRADGDLNNSGAVYRYERELGTWFEKQKLLAPLGNADAGADFGWAITYEEPVLVVGAPRESYSFLGGAGAVHVYQRLVDGSFAHTDRLVPLDANPGDLFGTAVAYHVPWLVVGAPNKDMWWDDRGAVYTFRREIHGWQVQSPWLAESAVTADHMGAAVAVAESQILAGIPEFGPVLPTLPVCGEFVVREVSVEPLLGCPRQISVSQGGTLQLRLEAGDAHAFDMYLGLGSFSGTVPGTSIDGLLVPLNPDAYFAQALSAPNLPPFDQTFGATDDWGRARMRITIPAGALLPLAGQSVYHAVLTWDLFTMGPAKAVSNAFELKLTP